MRTLNIVLNIYQTDRNGLYTTNRDITLGLNIPNYE